METQERAAKMCNRKAQECLTVLSLLCMLVAIPVKDNKHKDIMQTIKVFPDYCSSGLWDEQGHNLWADSFLFALTETDLMALKYWHEAWEFLLMDGAMEEPPVQRMSDRYVARWSEDGKALVDSFNSKQNEFNFIYEGDYWK